MSNIIFLGANFRFMDLLFQIVRRTGNKGTSEALGVDHADGHIVSTMVKTMMNIEMLLATRSILLRRLISYVNNQKINKSIIHGDTKSNT